ncbi:hypothetical protein [Halosegnis marinus]|uniref:hypothetical protein n=1 Tax=Halosegnis marinus TaxID=3034023 RepID=UPI003622EE10
MDAPIRDRPRARALRPARRRRPPRRGPLRETLVAVAGVDPGTAETVLLAFLVVVGLAVVAVEVRRQARGEPEFTLKAARQAYLESRVPARPMFGAYVLLLVAGTYVALFARETFFARLDNALLVVRRVAESGDPGAFSADALAFGAAFVVAAVTVAHAADRVLVAALRRVLASRR